MAVPTTVWNQLPPVVRRGNNYECYIYGEESPYASVADGPYVDGFQYKFWDTRNAEPVDWIATPPEFVTLVIDNDGMPTCEMLVNQSNLQNNRTYTFMVRAVDTLGQADASPLSYTFRAPLGDHEPRLTAKP